jgi:hypothetical protein
MTSKLTHSNQMFKRYFLGLSIMLMPWFIVVVVRIFGPITFNPLGWNFIAFLFALCGLSFIAFSFGYVIKNPRYGLPPSDDFQTSTTTSVIFKRMFTIVIFFALLYPALAFYDFLIVKGGSFDRIVEMREFGHETGPRGSLVGALIALLSGAPPIAFVIIVMNRALSSRKKAFLGLVVIVGFVATFLSGGRNPFFIGMLFMVVFYQLFLKSPKRRKKVKKRRLQMYTFKLAITLGIVYSMQIFIERYALRGVGPQGMMDHLSGYTSVESIARYEGSSNVSSMFYSIYVYLLYYATHALNYVNDYFVIGYEPFTWGGYSFPQLTRLVDTVFSTSYFAQSRVGMLVQGAYLTLPGSLYIDFGYVGTLIWAVALALLFGFLLRNLPYLALYQKVIACYLTVVYLFSPIYNIFGMGSGFSMFFLIVIMLLLSVRLFPKASSKQNGASRSVDPKII